VEKGKEDVIEEDTTPQQAYTMHLSNAMQMQLTMQLCMQCNYGIIHSIHLIHFLLIQGAAPQDPQKS
jgi:uncharacterized protein with PIN domain